MARRHIGSVLTALALVGCACAVQRRGLQEDQVPRAIGHRVNGGVFLSHEDLQSLLAQRASASDALESIVADGQAEGAEDQAIGGGGIWLTDFNYY